MAKPVIPDGKRRYSVSLTEKNVNEFKALVKDVGLTRNYMSIYLDSDIALGIKILKMIKGKQKEVGDKVDMEEIFTQILKEQKQLSLF